MIANCKVWLWNYTSYLQEVLGKECWKKDFPKFLFRNTNSRLWVFAFYLVFGNFYFNLWHNRWILMELILDWSLITYFFVLKSIKYIIQINSKFLDSDTTPIVCLTSDIGRYQTNRPRKKYFNLLSCPTIFLKSFTFQRTYWQDVVMFLVGLEIFVSFNLTYLMSV